MTMKTVFRFEDLPGLLSLMSGDEKHDPAALSTLDVLWVLYDRVLDVLADTAGDRARDRFLLSKGHGPQAYFAVLAAKGFFPPEVLSSFGRFDSPLGYHPDRLLVPGVEISSGSLGHGLAIAVGLALGLAETAEGGAPRVFCLMGDAELDEGSNHEAIALAGRLAPDRLRAIVVDNDSSSYGWPGGLEGRFAAEGWETVRVPSSEHDALALELGGPSSPGAPRLVVVEASSKDNSWRSLAGAPSRN
jgi:transketolase